MADWIPRFFPLSPPPDYYDNGDIYHEEPGMRAF